ncbi:MAG: hypothetical protein ACRDP1_02300 [Nocardioidaceae bacterium]
MLTVRQRIPSTVDPLGQTGQVISPGLVTARIEAVANLFVGMAQVHADLGNLISVLLTPTAPANLVAVLLQPDGSPAGRLQIQFNPATFNDPGPIVNVQTGDHGAFQLPFPKGMPLPDGSVVELTVHGGSGNNVSVSVPATQIAANGLAGAVMLPQFVAPLPSSIVAALQDLQPPPSSAATPPPLNNAPQLPVVSIGEGDGCLLQYGANSSVDRFPYGVFFRLVEPRASIVTEVEPHPFKPGIMTFLPKYASTFTLAAAGPVEPGPALGTSPSVLGESPPDDPGQVAYVDRIPVEQPISVDGFRDQLMGLQPDGTFTGDETRPMAGTLGLGYVLSMSQRWTFQGLALGNLVYSLPLAPGEQQQVAIFERVDTARVSESEFFTEEQAQQQSALADTSTQATFNSAFSEAVTGHSSFRTESDSSSWGGSLIIVSGGGGSSSASGTSSQSLQGQRNSSQQAAQATHSAAENQASARRSAARTGMRIATASESEQLTTKVITNHNHTRAMTMQYWEVQRLYDVTSAVDGLTLTVLVPLQVARFIPPGQPATLSDASQVSSRGQVLARYASIIKHGDVLEQALPRRLQHGLRMLLQFAADPQATVEPAGGVAEDVVQIALQGTFLAAETIYITAVSDRGTRIGPVKLANNAAHIPQEEFQSKEQLTEWLVQQRQSSISVCTGALALPPTMNRANIVGFEISRIFAQVAYTLVSAAVAEMKALQQLLGASTDWINQALASSITASNPQRSTVFLSPGDLETSLGGPQVFNFQAAIEELDASGNAVPSSQEQYANDSLGGIELPQQPYPVPARQLAPVLRYNEILEIERMAAHVVRRTLTYSRAIWASMSDDERAILLEAYTIGVPPGGLADATQMVPLLNCVENRVLGYFGNSMIMPFIIPQALAQSDQADGTPLDPVKLHDALLAYQTTTFTPPHSTIALPTRGVLAEAVLGHCPSAEKVDLRRFWNWQDSPADTAPTISPVQLPTTSESIAAAMTAPNSLTTLPSLINNVLTAPSPDSALLQALGQAAAGQKDFESGLTGAAQLAGLVQNAQNTANLARADALKTTKDLTAQAMATVGNIVGGMKGNPTAGSTAAAAVAGKSDGTTPAPAAKTDDKKPPATGGKAGTGAPAPGAAGTPAPGAGAPTPAPGPPPEAPDSGS